MKIAIPIQGFARQGGYRVLSELASAWVRLGHQVLFLSPKNSGAPYFPTSADIAWVDDDGSPTERLDSLRSGKVGITRNLLALYRGMNLLAHDHDIVLANHSLTAWPVVAARTRAAKFYYVQAYEPEYYSPRRDFAGQVIALAAVLSYRLPLERIVNAPVYFEYKALRADRAVPPGLDMSLFYPRQAPSYSNKPVTLGFIGRSEPDKGIKFAVSAYEQLLQSGAPVQLRVAYGNIPEQVVALPGVTVVVPSNDKELGDFYRSLDVLIAPGIVQHGAPHYPVMEAMACGVPVVTTGYLPASDRNAWLVPSRDAAAIARTVRHMLTNGGEVERRRQQALSDISGFTWAHVAQQMLAEFAAALDGQKK